MGQILSLVPAVPSSEPNPEVEAFLATNTVEASAGARLRMLPPQVQRLVIDRGTLHGARNASAVLNSRIQDAIAGAGCASGVSGIPPPPSGGPGVHLGIEGLVARFNLDASCAQMLRNLPQHMQVMAADLPVHEARNPSAFVMAQLRLPRFREAQALGVPQPIPGSMFHMI